MERSGPVKCAPYLFGIMATDLIIPSEINSRVYRFVYHSVEQNDDFSPDFSYMTVSGSLSFVNWYRYN